MDEKQRMFEGGAATGSDNSETGPDAADRLPRKERERAMHRDAILDAARNLLAHKPYDQITVQEIAAGSEFSVGYIYRIFESKDDIYVTLIRRMGDELIGVLDRGLTGKGPFEDRLRGLVHGVYAWLEANPAFTANHIHEIHCLVRTLPRLGAAHIEREEIMRDRIKPFFDSAIRSGEIAGEMDTMVRTLRALVWGFVGEDLFHDENRGKWTQYTSLVVRVFMRTFAPEGGSE
jgi:AcrR family transcriptional regulator